MTKLMKIAKRLRNVQSEFRKLVMKAIKTVEMPKRWQRDPRPEQQVRAPWLSF